MIKHTPGPWKKNEGTSRFHITAPRSENGNRYICSLLDDAIGEQDTNLITLAPTAPHECDDLKCPGNVNRMKLELLDKIICDLKEYFIVNGVQGSIDLCDDIAKAEAIEKGAK
jgi:hypothetical protein